MKKSCERPLELSWLSLITERKPKYVLKGKFSSYQYFTSTYGTYGKNPINLIDDTELLGNSVSQKAAVLGKFYIC